MYRKCVLVLAVGLTAVTAACGGGGGVGGDLDSVENGGNEGAIGQATTTTVATATTAAVAATTVKATPTTAAAQPNAVFTINNDTKGQYIEPLQHAVRVGNLVRFVNADDKAHVISGRVGGQVVLGPSPSIPPGGSWDVRPTKAGTYDIIDEQRTYAQGVTLTVVS